MRRRLTKPVAKARGPRVRYAALVAEVEFTKRPRRVPGRQVAVVPLATLRRLRELEKRAVEDREDRAAVDAAVARPQAYSSLDDVRRRLLG